MWEGKACLFRACVCFVCELKEERGEGCGEGSLFFQVLYSLVVVFSFFL